jgi:hypothetical protein
VLLKSSVTFLGTSVCAYQFPTQFHILAKKMSLYLSLGTWSKSYGKTKFRNLATLF